MNMHFHNTGRLIIWLFLVLTLCVPREVKATTKAQYSYITAKRKAFTTAEILHAYKEGSLTNYTKPLNLGLNVNQVWVVIKPEGLVDNQYLMFENAHLDTIEAFFYSYDKLIATKMTGDRLDFDTRDIEHNYLNFKIPATTTLILLNVKTDGAMLVPIKLFTLEEYFGYGFKTGTFHWAYFGFVFLILISSVIALIWTRESIYFYYFLSVLSIGFITAVDNEYTFEYLWPHLPGINKYNIIFYCVMIFSFIFSEKLFRIKETLPSLYKAYQVIYVLFALIIVAIFFAPYNYGLRIYTLVGMMIKVMSFGTAVYFFFFFKNSTSKLFLLGWSIYSLSAIVFNFYLSGNIAYSFFMSNLLQIGTGLQIILFNTAILSRINVLKIKAEAREAVLKNEMTMNSVFNGMQQSLWIVDKEHKLVKWNNRFVENVKALLNIKITEESAGRDVKEVFPIADADFWIASYDKVFKGENVYFEKLYEETGRVIEYSLYPIIINEVVTSAFVISNEITATIKTTEAALKSEITLNSVLNSILHSVWIVDKEYNLVKYNDRFLENAQSLLGVTVKDGDLRKAADAAKSLDRAFWEDLYARALKGEQIYVEKKWEGSNRIFEYYIYPIFVNDEVTNVFVLSNEITEKVKQQEEIKINEEKYRSLIENTPAAILVFDTDQNKIVEANPRALVLFNRSKEELLSMNPFELSPKVQENGKSSEEENLSNIRKALDGVILNYEWTFATKEGDPIPTQIWLNKLPGSRLLRATIADISERVSFQKKQKELILSQSSLIEKIKEHEAGLTALINNTSDYILALDTNLNFTEFNEPFKKIVKKAYNIDMVKGMNMNDLITPELKEKSDENFSQALSGKSVRSIIEVPGHDEDPIFIDIAYSPIFTENKVIGLTIIARDISENKRAEKELIEINNQIVEYKLVALRSVMNPHFLFNSLNSIQYFVAKNERKLALDYLSLFSSLIRKILNSAVNNTIPLNTELEILKNYIILEQLRFEGQFDYSIEVDPEVELDSIQIPSLLIQPYVENAILHGVMNKENGKGILRIRLFLDGDYLIFEVEDNGVGRERAYEIKRSRPIKEKSYGMLLTQERLDILNKTATVAVKIEDLVGTKGEPTGTKVIVSIKI